MGNVFSYIIIGVYFLTAFVLMVYGLNCYLMVFLFQKGRKGAETWRRRTLNRYTNMNSRVHWPRVTTQIPIYNEYNVAARVMRSVARMNYPKDKHEIQVLDDSTDKTRDLIDRVADELRREGHVVHVIRRNSREGFKAGALAEGLNSARGKLIAIFDADFA
ncbi:MAG TPA: glycosyltransferase, partial [Desulfobacteria bacterium]|nr:glycosyltransferase [Desulfobacteria bacterium]